MSTRIIRIVCAVVVALAAAVAAASITRADEGPAPAAAVQCPGPDESSLAAVDCEGGSEPVADSDPADTPERLARAAAVSAAEAALPHQCRYHGEVVFYAATDWLRLARLLAADTSYCSDYSISIPPVVADKRKPRSGEAAKIKAFGPMFHPLAEIHYATWQRYFRTPGWPTPYDAGVDAGRRTIAAGYDLWALNEVPSSVRQGTPGARADIAEFIRGLHDGSGVTGLVFVAGVGQRTSPIDVYRTNLTNWLVDGLFWSSISDSVRFWAQEAYGDVRAWAVPGASRNDRTRHLADYLLHEADLAGTLGAAAEPAQQLLERTFVPFGNAAWRWTSGFGNTDVDVPLMQSFVTEQVFAVRHYAGAHPQGAPAGRIGMAYAPRPSAPVDAVGNGAVLERIASATHEAYEEGGGSQMGACGVPGDHVWCQGELAGAAFVDAWDAFATHGG